MSGTGTAEHHGSQPIPSNASPRRPRGRRGLAIAAATIAAVAIVGTVLGLFVYVFPPQGEPNAADVVYVIGPPTPERLTLADDLQAEFPGSTILVSVGATGYFSADALDECDRADVVCETPTPFTTKGEAAMLTTFGATHATDDVVVITFTPHVARTRYIFDKCYEGEVTVVGVDSDLTILDWAYQYAYQSAAFVKAWATSCADLTE